MKSQAYGVLGLMYAVAIGVLLIIAVVGTSKQFNYQSSASMYKLWLTILSSNVQKIKMFLQQERAYAVERALFFTSAFGGHSFEDFIPIRNGSVCGCINGYTPDTNSGACVSSEGYYYPICYKDRYTGKIFNVTYIPKEYYSTIPEKYVAYWVTDNGYAIPSWDEVANNVRKNIQMLFPIPDPALTAPLSMLGSQMNFRYDAYIWNFTKNEIDVKWIPLGQDKITIAYPDIYHPKIYYSFGLSLVSFIKTDFYALYLWTVEFVKGKEYQTGFEKMNSSLPMAIDENFVVNYTNSLGIHYCNYTTSETPVDSQKCSTIKQPINNLGPIRALVYYTLNHYSLHEWTCANVGITEGTCSYYKDVPFDEPTTTTPICKLEVHPTLVDGKIRLYGVKFYGWCTSGTTAANAMKCAMCYVLSNLSDTLNPYVKSISDNNYSVKLLPLSNFNLTLDSTSISTYVWTNKTFVTWININPYLASGDTIKYGERPALDSLCELNGFTASTGKVRTVNSYCDIWGYNVVRGDKVYVTASYPLNITELVCNNSGLPALVYVEDSNGKFAVPAKYITTKTLKVGSNYMIHFYPGSLYTLADLQIACEAATGNENAKLTYVTLGICNGGYIGDLEIVGSSKNYGSGYAVSEINCTQGIIISPIKWNAWGTTGWTTSFSYISGGKLMADIACKVNGTAINGNSVAKEIKIVSNVDNRIAPVLNLSVSGSQYGVVIKSITCNDSGTLFTYDLKTLNDNPRITGSDYVFVSKRVPIQLVSLYQPIPYANQAEILNRICYEHGYGDVVQVINGNEGTYLLWDVGKSIGAKSGACVSEIQCIAGDVS